MERKLSRRKILGAAGAFAGGSALAATTAVAAAGLPAARAALVADPILALDAERRRLDQAHTQATNTADARRFSVPLAARKDDAQLAALDRVADDLSRAMVDAEDRMLAIPASTVAGLVAQLAVMREFAEAYDGIALVEPLATIEVGIKRVVGAAS
jgi:hypothetical protein